MDNYTHPLWNHFATWYIDRVADKRRDDQWLAAQLKDERTRFIPVWKFKNLFTVEQVPEPILLSHWLWSVSGFETNSPLA
jgi:hypothetical protein